MCVTNDPAIAERMQLIRNHGEAVVGKKGMENIANILGFNFRLGEIEAAIGIEQLKKLPGLVDMRYKTGLRLNDALRDLPGIQVPVIRNSCTHAFYIYAFTVDSDVTGVTRERLIEALQAEGVPWLYGGYQNVHLLPVFQKKIAYGSRGFPWTSDVYKGSVRYDKGICPTAERLHDRDLVCLQICQHRYTDDETDRVIEAFRKVWKHLDKLQQQSPPSRMSSLRAYS
jgi:dTDP-4-amino-4,6-dideoxygalactose transaminase